MEAFSSNPDSNFSSAILKGIAQRITSQQFETWFRNVNLSVTLPDKVLLAVPNRFHQVWIEKRYNTAITETARQFGIVSPRVTFEVDPNLQKSIVPQAAEEPEQPESLCFKEYTRENCDSLGQVLNSDYTFDNFVVGPSNHFCHAAVRAVAGNPGENYNPLFIHGASGLGKTHLLQALCHLLEDRQYKTAYLSCEDFTNHFISSLDRGNLNSFRWRYRHVDVLVIDDVHFLAQKEKTQEEFFHTFNNLYNNQKQIVLSSDRHPKDIPHLEERLLSRLKWGLLVRLETPPLETRVEIVKKKAGLRGLPLGDMEAHFIAERVKENVRELEGAVNGVIYISRLNERKVDLELLKEALSLLGPTPKVKKGPSLPDIIRAVAHQFGVRAQDLQSRKQTKSVAFPRQLCMYLARKYTQCSLEEIGGHFGGRDHTTVHYGIKKIEKLVKNSHETRQLVKTLTGSLQNRAQ